MAAPNIAIPINDAPNIPLAISPVADLSSQMNMPPLNVNSSTANEFSNSTGPENPKIPTPVPDTVNSPAPANPEIPLPVSNAVNNRSPNKTASSNENQSSNATQPTAKENSSTTENLNNESKSSESTSLNNTNANKPAKSLSESAAKSSSSEDKKTNNVANPVSQSQKPPAKEVDQKPDAKTTSASKTPTKTISNTKKPASDTTKQASGVTMRSSNRPSAGTKTSSSATTARPKSAVLSNTSSSSSSQPTVASSTLPKMKKSAGDPTASLFRSTASATNKNQTPRPPGAANSRVVRSTPNSISDHHSDTTSHRSMTSVKSRATSQISSGRPPWCSSYSPSTSNFVQAKFFSTPAAKNEPTPSPLSVVTTWLPSKNDTQSSSPKNSNTIDESVLSSGSSTRRSRVKPRDFVIHPEWGSEANTIRKLDMVLKETPYLFASGKSRRQQPVEHRGGGGGEESDTVGALVSPRVFLAAGAEIETANPVWPRRCRSAPPNKVRNPLSWEMDPNSGNVGR